MRLKADMHNHSDNSEDSHASLDSMCDSAIKKGINIMAFTEHVDFNSFDSGYHFFDESRYSLDIIEARKHYSENLTILKGIEFGEIHLYQNEFKTSLSRDYDVILGSVHMIDDLFVGDERILSRYTIDQLFKKYYKIMLDMVQCGGFDVLAHFDFPKRYYHKNPTCRNLTDEILKTMIQKDITLEINTSPLRKGYHETSPGNLILSRYAMLGGVKVTIGTDAHAPEEVGKNLDLAINLINSQNGLRKGYFQNREFIEW
jgi:histidinol-phosphatase (PHP family)